MIMTNQERDYIKAATGVFAERPACYYSIPIVEEYRLVATEDTTEWDLDIISELRDRSVRF